MLATARTLCALLQESSHMVSIMVCIVERKYILASSISLPIENCEITKRWLLCYWSQPKDDAAVWNLLTIGGTGSMQITAHLCLYSDELSKNDGFRP